MRLAAGMADHYLCELGQVLEALVPAGVRGQAGTREMTFLSVPTEVAARLSTLKLPPKQLDAIRVLMSADRVRLRRPNCQGRRLHDGSPIQELRKKKLIRSRAARIQTHVRRCPAGTPAIRRCSWRPTSKPRSTRSSRRCTRSRHESILAARRHRQRQNRSLHSGDRRGAQIRPAGDRARARNQPHAANAAAVPFAISAASPCCTAT